MSKVSLLLFLALLVSNCSYNITDEEKLESFYTLHKPEGEFSKFNKVVVINELGGCLNCTSMFVNEIKDSTFKTNILFIVSSSGAKVDISPFIDSTKSNIIWDSNSDFDEFDILKKSGVIYLDSNSKISKKELIN
jgi:hypothetical protein